MRKGAGRWVLAAYVLALIASQVVMHLGGGTSTTLPAGTSVAQVPKFNAAGNVATGTWSLLSKHFPADAQAFAASTARPTVVLLHGSPGSAGDFDALAAGLVARGYRVVVPDLLGYGGATREVREHPPLSRSIAAYAGSLTALIEQQDLGRVHIVGWSNGGGVALHMADRAPERIASLTLMASIGLQESEWSGSHAFEHFKYALTYAYVGWLPELLPHFGALGTFSVRTAWLDFFAESDQRPLRDVMRRVGERGTPTLILHGRHDVLVPDYAAEAHFELVKSSRLIMLDANHFIPFLQVEEGVDELTKWFARFDAERPATAGFVRSPWHEVEDRAPVARLMEGPWLDRQLLRIKRATPQTNEAIPWWARLACLGVGAVVAPSLTMACAVLLMAHAGLDPAMVMIAFVGAMLLHGAACAARGRASRVDWTRRMTRRPYLEGYRSQFVEPCAKVAARGASIVLRDVGFVRVLAFWMGRIIAAHMWVLAAIIPAMLLETLVLAPYRGAMGWLATPVTLAALMLAAWTCPLVLTRVGRQRMRAKIGRVLHHEYWPTGVFYLPLVPYLAYRSIRHRGLGVVTCCNPEIENGGGWAGESKVAIMRKLAGAGPVVLATHLIPAGGSAVERVEMLRQLMAQHPEIGTLPIVLKPDIAQRGHAFKVLRTMEQAGPYFEEMTGDAIAQPFHAGPEECGIFWIRNRDAAAGGPRGFIYSITRKAFPSVTGDGRRTVEELILAHRRYRKQAEVFLERCEDEASRVLADGEVFALAVSGNHCQGTLFRDGADLVTPALEAEVDRIASHFPRLDLGRFDARYTNDADLRAGRGLAIIELNGTSSEPTNMYDPDRSPLFAYRVLVGMWRHQFELGEQRRREGVKPLTAGRFLALVRENKRQLKGRALAD